MKKKKKCHRILHPLVIVFHWQRFYLLVSRHACLVYFMATAELSKRTLSQRLDLLTKRSMKVALRVICVVRFNKAEVDSFATCCSLTKKQYLRRERKSRLE